MAMRFSIPAVQTLALVPALLPCPEALAVVFLARRFLARASPRGDVGGDACEVARLAVVGHPLGVVDAAVVGRMVAAAHADAFFIATLPPREAFAIELQTVYLCALASRRLLFRLHRTCRGHK